MDRLKESLNNAVNTRQRAVSTNLRKIERLADRYRNKYPRARVVEAIGHPSGKAVGWAVVVNEEDNLWLDWTGRLARS